MPSSPNPPAALDDPATQLPVRADHADSPAKDTDPETAEDQEDGQDREPGEVDAEPEAESSKASEKAPASEDAPPLPNEPTPDGPPLPNEPVPTPEDDGWDCQWDPSAQSWYFVNRFTGKSQWDNPRVPVDAAPVTNSASMPPPPTLEKPAAGGYNPAIHGDYDPNAWYAKGGTEEGEPSSSAALGDPTEVQGVTASFNRFTGQFQTDDMGPNRHTDEAKSRRQMNAFFDVDAAANAHDGRSLKAERSGKKPSKNELKAFKEKRRARKEEKRRAWLRD
ncbi:WW domain protein [Ilyonectria sp. MPI-CAGE-AT-0026]|nr:WW domain protein [Ilyonectria sp. MPI-CAGE-AT-0026]